MNWSAKKHLNAVSSLCFCFYNTWKMLWFLLVLGFFSPLWLEVKPPSNLNCCILGIFRTAKISWEILPLDCLAPSSLKPGVWGSGSFRLNLVSAFQHPNKSPNSVWCCCALSMRALWATPGLLGSGNWGNHSPKSASKALIALVEANSVEDVKAHSGVKLARRFWCRAQRTIPLQQELSWIVHLGKTRC